MWFADRGMSGAQIGLILSLPMLARAFTAPLLAIWADSFRLRRTALLFLSLAVSGLFLLEPQPSVLFSLSPPAIATEQPR